MMIESLIRILQQLDPKAEVRTTEWPGTKTFAVNSTKELYLYIDPKNGNIVFGDFETKPARGLVWLQDYMNEKRKEQQNDSSL